MPVNATALSSLPAANSGMASSAVNTSRELGAVAGVAILGSIVNGQLTVNLTARLIQTRHPGVLSTSGHHGRDDRSNRSSRGGSQSGDAEGVRGLIKKVVNAAYGALTHGLDIALIASALLLLVSAAVAYTTGTAEKLDMVDYVEQSRAAPAIS